MNKPEESGLTSKTTREYLDVQLNYTHDDQHHPSSAHAVTDEQHESIAASGRDESPSRRLYFLDIGCGMQMRYTEGNTLAAPVFTDAERIINRKLIEPA
jgi:hypothetical protein